MCSCFGKRLTCFAYRPSHAVIGLHGALPTELRTRRVVPQSACTSGLRVFALSWVQWGTCALIVQKVVLLHRQQAGTLGASFNDGFVFPTWRTEGACSILLSYWTYVMLWAWRYAPSYPNASTQHTIPRSVSSVNAPVAFSFRLWQDKTTTFGCMCALIAPIAWQCHTCASMEACFWEYGSFG
jgi:hypothetical protein